jgi:hypothetical protein
MSTRVAVWKKGLPKRFTLRGFIRRHNSVLTITGAIIVFLTFTVKEELRDKAREWSESSRQGLATYFLEQQLAPLTAELNGIRLQTGISARRSLGVKSADIAQSSYTDRINIDAGLLEGLVMRGAAMLFSMKELPDKERRPDAIAAGNLVDTADDEIKKLTNIHGSPGEDPAELKAIEAKTNELEKDAEELGHKVVSEVQEQGTVFDEAYESLDFLSYVLYAVGWGLALVGKLYGGGEIAGAE